MKRPAITLVVLIFLSVAGFAAWKYLYQAPPSDPAETWVAGRGIVRTLKLLGSGDYIADEVCDVCTSKPVHGRWSRSNDQITLVPSISGSTSVLVEVRYRGCVGLVPAEKAEGIEGLPLRDIYFREKDTCPDSL